MKPVKEKPDIDQITQQLAAVGGDRPLKEEKFTWLLGQFQSAGGMFDPLPSFVVAAIKHNYLDVLKILLIPKIGFTRKVDFTSRDPDGRTAAYLAAMYGQLKVLELFRRQGIDLTLLSKGGQTPAHAAAENGHAELLETWGEWKMDLSFSDEYGQTPAHVGAWGKSGKSAAVLEAIGNNGGDLTSLDHCGQAPSYWTVVNGDLAAFRVLRKFKAVEDGPHPGDGWRLAHVAVQEGGAQHIEILMELKKDAVLGLTTRAEKGLLPVHVAAINKNEKMLAFFQDNGFGLHIEGEFWIDLAWRAARNVDVYTLSWLKSKGFDLSTILPAAAKAGQMHVLEFLRENKVDLLAKDQRGWTILHHAAKEGNIDLLDFLKKSGLDLNTTIAYGFPLTPVHIAAEAGELEVLKFLRESGIDLEAKTESEFPSETPARLAAQKGHMDVLRFLHESGVDLLNGDRHHSGTLAHMAAKRGNVRVLRFLREIGANLQAKDRFDRTPAQIAVREGQRLVLHFLHESGVDLINDVFDYGNTLAHTAARYGYVGILLSLKDIGLNLFSVKNNCGHTVHYVAQRYNQPKVIEFLEKQAELELSLQDKEKSKPGLMPTPQISGNSYGLCSPPSSPLRGVGPSSGPSPARRRGPG